MIVIQIAQGAADIISTLSHQPPTPGLRKPNSKLNQVKHLIFSPSKI